MAAEAERESFFKWSTKRAPGKRQIKPTAAVAEMVLPADDDEDDTEFRIDGADTGSSGDSSSSSSDSDSGSDSDEEGDDRLEDDEAADLNDEIANTVPSDKEPLICSVCLNLRDAVQNDEVIQCDRCGVCVHEACYGTDLGDDAESSISTSSTEPWFCEPCLFGLMEPPYCELCPNRYGAFKRTDIGGRWIHLVCAFYTPGTTFGDAEKLTAVSVMEMDFAKNFGRKPCSGCTSKLSARVGVATQCDAALCKTYFHPTCAQKLGLLSEHENANGTDEAVIHCKKHSSEELVRRKRVAYAKFLRYEEKRMITLKRKKLTEREERFRLRNHARLVKTHKLLEGITICWPGVEFDKAERKQRKIRPLHTSARLVEAFAEKAEDQKGISRDEFEAEFFKVRGETLPFLPPGFSQEFVAYFHHREKNVFGHEQRRLEGIQQQNLVLKERLRDLEEKAQKGFDPEKELDSLLKRFEEFHGALVVLGVKKIVNPFEELIRERKNSASRSRKRKSSVSHLNGASTSKENVSPTRKRALHACKECGKTNDQHLLIECDQCHFHYHLRCLDPPLDRMPKKNNFDWHCSNCMSDDESDEETAEVSDEDRPRKLRQRSDSTRARKLQEAEAQKRAYRSVMQTARKRPRVKAAASKLDAKVTRRTETTTSPKTASSPRVLSPSSRPSSKASMTVSSPRLSSGGPPSGRSLTSPSGIRRRLTGHDSVQDRDVYIGDNGLPTVYDSDVSEEFCLLD